MAELIAVKHKLFLQIIVFVSIMLDDASSTFMRDKGFQVIQVTDYKMEWECEISLLAFNNENRTFIMQC